MHAHSEPRPADAAHAPSTPPMAKGLKRMGYLALAYASLGCALLGMILPGLPTTEFVLLCAWASAKSSPRLQRWLWRHRLFGPLLRDWRNGGIVRRRSKLLASLSMGLCFAILLWHQPPLWLLLGAGGGMSCGALWLWSRPEDLPHATCPGGGERH